MVDMTPAQFGDDFAVALGQQNIACSIYVPATPPGWG